MRDCPACKVPLHGYEDVCPSCGTKQYPTKGGGGRVPFGSAWKPEEPRVNIVPFVVVILAVGAFLLVAMQNTWIGKLMRHEQQEPDPISKLSYGEARQIIDGELNKNLTSVGARNVKLSWKVPNSTDNADARAVDGPVELTVDCTLPSADSRRQVIDPIKPYMEPAKLYALMMNDSRSHAHWTYNMTPGSAPEPDAMD